RHEAEGAGHRSALAIDVAAEAGEAADGEGEIELVFFLESVLLRLGEDGVAELLRLLGLQRRRVQRNELAVDAQLRGRPDGDVQVGCPLVHHCLEQCLKAEQGDSSRSDPERCWPPLPRWT